MDRVDRRPIEQKGRVLVGPDQYTLLVLRCTARPTLGRPDPSDDPVGEVQTGVVLVARFATALARALGAQDIPAPRLEVDAVLSFVHERNGDWTLTDAFLDIRAELPDTADPRALLSAATAIAEDRASWGANAAAIVHVRAEVESTQPPSSPPGLPTRQDPGPMARLNARARRAARALPVGVSLLVGSSPPR